MHNICMGRCSVCMALVWVSNSRHELQNCSVKYSVFKSVTLSVNISSISLVLCRVHLRLMPQKRDIIEHETRRVCMALARVTKYKYEQ